MATFRTSRLVLIGYEAHKEHTLMNDTIPDTEVTYSKNNLDNNEYKAYGL